MTTTLITIGFILLMFGLSLILCLLLVKDEKLNEKITKTSIALILIGSITISSVAFYQGINKTSCGYCSNEQNKNCNSCQYKIKETK